jgi:hypothetical protein
MRGQISEKRFKQNVYRKEGASREQLRVCGDAAAEDFFLETNLEAEIPSYSWRCVYSSLCSRSGEF